MTAVPRVGINVAKVREVLPTGEITTLSKAHPSVRGVFQLRDNVIPCASPYPENHISSRGTRLKPREGIKALMTVE
jgi:chemotaxis signal transduction protein